MIIIVMGVCGSGKSTIGSDLASKLDLPFFDADDFHPKANVNKMANGQPLDDTDRLPWLEILANKLKDEQNTVLACSALKEKYREILQSKVDQVHWVYLQGEKELIAERMKSRGGHYMKGEMLDSQFATLEVPSYGHHISIDQEPEQVVRQLIEILNP